MRTIEQMKTDIQVMKGTHNQEVKRFQTDMEGMRAEMEVTKSDLEECQNQNMDLTTANKSQSDELDRYQRVQEEKTIEVRLWLFSMYRSFATSGYWHAYKSFTISVVVMPQSFSCTYTSAVPL